jgi:hypothetical protein
MNTVFATLPLFAELQVRGWFYREVALLLGVLAVAAVVLVYVREALRTNVRPAIAAVVFASAVVGAVLLFVRVLAAVDEERTSWWWFIAAELAAATAVGALCPLGTGTRPPPGRLAAGLALAAVGLGLLACDSLLVVVRGGSAGFVAAFVVLPWVQTGAVWAMAAFHRSGGYLGTITAVRVLSLTVVAFLLLRPVSVTDTTVSKRRPIAVLIDASQSMDANDPRPGLDDQWRAAIAYGLVEPDKPRPAELPRDGSRMPDRPKRIEVAREALTNANPKLDLFKRLRESGPLEVSTFGATRTGRDAYETDWLTKLKADQPRTALVAAAFELLNRDDSEQPAAIVLVTDGRDNDSGKSFSDLAARCRARKIPLHVYGVGSSAFGQLRLRDAAVPESVFVNESPSVRNDEVSVPVRYEVRGLPKGEDGTPQGRVEFAVKFGDQEVKWAADAREGDDLREVLKFTPTKKDAAAKTQDVTVTVTVTVPGQGGAAAETLTDTITKPTQVTTKRLKVLAVDGLPRADFKFLMRGLLRDHRVDARFFLTEGDREAMKSGYPWLKEFTRQLNGTLSLDRDEFRKLLYAYDLLVLGDVPAKFFSAEQQQVVKDFVAEGGGMIHVAGRWNAPRGWREGEPGRASIADVLPVELDAFRWPVRPPEDGRYYQPFERRPYRPFVPVLAANATRSPLVALEDDPLDNADVWGRLARPAATDPAAPPEPEHAGKKKQLPPLEWYYPATRLKPGAETFLVHPTARTPAPDNKPMPLLVGHYFGKGYVLFCAFDDTWRWRFNEGDRYFGRFWSQCVYQAGSPRTVGTKLTQVSLDTPEPLEGKSGQVYARVLDDKFRPLAADELDATLENLDAAANDRDRTAPVKLRKLDGQDGEYVAPLPFNRAGRFKLSVDPKNGSPAALEYRVSRPPDHELAPGGMAEPELKALAAGSGSKDNPGKFYHEEDLYRLPADVAAQSAPVTRRDESVLWNGTWMVALIALLSLEWFLRKFNGLS